MTTPDAEIEANRIENIAAERSYNCGFGVTEWEAFLYRDEVARLIDLAEKGFGTWGKEPETLKMMKELQGSNQGKP